MLALAVLYEVPPDPANFWKPPPWPNYAVGALFWAHLCISAGATVTAYRVVRDRRLRVYAWALLFAWTGLAAFVALQVSMATSGTYL